MAKIFSEEKRLVRRYGYENSRAIMKRLKILEAAPTLAHVPIKSPERRHELEGKMKGKFAVDVRHPHRLIFEPNHDSLPRKQDGGLDLSRVTAITIIEVKNYH